MSSLVRRLIIANLFALSLASLVGLFSFPLSLFIVFAALLAQLVFHLVNLAKLERFSRAPSMDENLTGAGVWSGIFSRLYRHEKKMHHALFQQREEVALFMAAVEALTDGVLLLDRHWRIVFCNSIAEQQFGLLAHKDQGQVILDLIRQPDFVAHLQAGDFKEPLRLRGEYGEQVFSVHIMPYAKDYKLMQVRNITQNERVEAMRRDFVANVSHELRTPLTVLAGFIETLQEIPLTKEEQHYYLSQMGEQSTRMQTIVQDLLMLSTIESAPPPVEAAINMSRLLRKLCAEATRLSNGKHEITSEIDEHLDLIASENEIRSAFNNLVSNAIRYTPTGKKVHIAWQNTQAGARFSVKDEGIGIAAKHIPRLTERFYRVDKGRSRDNGGTGLGLSITKHVIQRHLAELFIESEEGKGSTFSIQFPQKRSIATKDWQGAIERVLRSP